MNLQASITEDTFHLGIKALMRNDAGEILLLKVNPAKLHGEHRDYWDLPGGRVQQGQTVLDTLKREVAEETGITTLESPKEIGMVLSNIRIPMKAGGDVGLILGIYECRAPNTPIVLSDENLAYEWYAPVKAAELLAVKYPPHFCELVATL